MVEKKLSVQYRIAAFGHAFRGLGELFRSEPNAWIHLIVACMVVGAGILFNISATEWLFITLIIGAVFVAETFNSAIERLSDKICPEHDDLVKKAKDLGAAGVLFAAIMAVVVGLIIFVPKIIALL